MFRYDVNKEDAMSEKNFYEITEEIRKMKRLTISELVRLAGISPQLRYHWRDSPGASPSLPVVKRMEQNLHVRFIIGEEGKPIGWEDELSGLTTPASVKDLVRSTVDWTHRSLVEQVRQMFDAARDGMDAAERKKLEAEYDAILYRMESVTMTANHELTMLFREAQRTIKEYLTKEDGEDEADNRSF